MKYNFFCIRNIFKQLSLTGFLLALSAGVFANINKKVDETEKVSQSALRVLQAGELETTLSLQFNNDNPVNFDFIIKDESGNLLYRKNHLAANFSQQFKLVNQSETSDAHLTLAIFLADGKHYDYNITNSISIVSAAQVIKK